MAIHPDYRDLLSELNAADVEYLVVGAHALAYHAEPRYTKDLDIWVQASAENAPRVYSALTGFGAPLQEVETTTSRGPDSCISSASSRFASTS